MANIQAGCIIILLALTITHFNQIGPLYCNVVKGQIF